MRRRVHHLLLVIALQTGPMFLARAAGMPGPPGEFVVDTDSDVLDTSTLVGENKAKCSLRGALANIFLQSNSLAGLTNPNCSVGTPKNTIKFKGVVSVPVSTFLAIDALVLPGAPTYYDVTIDGAGIVHILGNGGGNGLFVINSSAGPGHSNPWVTFKDLTFEGSESGAGGAIRTNGSNALMIVDHCRFVSNKANSGGAIALDGGSTSVLLSTFENNTASFHGGAIHIGGTGTLEVSESLFTENSAGSSGGAIACASASVTLGLFGAGFLKNGVQNNSGDGARGGALYNACASSDTGGIHRSQFTNNYAVNGGAIYNGANAPSLRIKGSSFKGNDADYDPKYADSAPTGAPNGSGGAIYTDSALDITQSALDGNHAHGGNGGGLFVANAAGDGAVDISNVTFVKNSAIVPAPEKAIDVGNAGGALYIGANAHKVRILNNTFLKNVGTTTIHYEESIPGETASILFINNIATRSATGLNPKEPFPSDAPPSFFHKVCGGQVDRMAGTGQTLASNLQFPGESCDTTFNKVPVVNPGLKEDSTPHSNGTAMTSAIPTAAAALNTGDAQVCVDLPVESLDQLGKPRTVNKPVPRDPATWTCTAGSREP